MIRFGVIELGEFGMFEVALPSEPMKLAWREAKVYDDGRQSIGEDSDWIVADLVNVDSNDR